MYERLHPPGFDDGERTFLSCHKFADEFKLTKCETQFANESSDAQGNHSGPCLFCCNFAVMDRRVRELDGLIRKLDRCV